MSVPLPPTTFGFSSRNDWTSRVSRGRSRSCCSSRPRLMAWLSSVMLFAPSADTVIVSFTPPTSRATSTSAVPAARTSMPVLSAFLKFCATTSTRYVPGLRFDASYRPSASVSTLRSAPVASSTIRTAAPLSAAPCGSTTVPRMVPRKDCATAGPAHAKRMSSSHVITRPDTPDRASRPGVTACVRIVFLFRWSIDIMQPLWSQLQRTPQVDRLCTFARTAVNGFCAECQSA